MLCDYPPGPTWWHGPLVQEPEPITADEALSIARGLYGKSYPLDHRLWYVDVRCGGRDYLTGNPHTFPGHVAAFCPHIESGWTVVVSEIVEMSPEARIWLDGFLAGNEPSPPTEDAELAEDATPQDRLDVYGDGETKHAAWQAAVRRFRTTGEWDTAVEDPV